MAFFLGFLPWILYWVLIGNAPFRVAVVAVLALAVALALVQRARGAPPRSLDRGSLVVFAVLAVAAFVVPDPVLERWLQPLSNGGLFLVALVGLLVGRPFVTEYAADTVDEATARTDGFRVITTGMTRLWVVLFAGMTVSALIPPIVDGTATIQDEDDLLSVVCYWIVPFALVGLGALVSSTFPPWFERRSAELDARDGGDPDPVPQATPAPAPSSTGGLHLEVPADSRHDERFGVVVRGAPAGAPVRVTTEGTDLFGRAWRSAATLTATDAGVVDLGVQAPDAGDWSGADPDAPVWSMRFVEPDTVPEMFVPPAEPWVLTVRATVEGSAEASATTVVRRRAAEPGVRFAGVEVDGRPGMLALPPAPAPAGGWPAVACFGGSEGGYESQIAAAGFLASHGYAALAATWVTAGDAAPAHRDGADEPATGVVIADVPLERFGVAVRWLADHEEVDPERVVAMGISRGAEGLLAAACAPAGPPLCGLVLVSPSSVAWQAVGPAGEIPDTASWTLGGAPVPWAALPSGALMPQILRNAWRVDRDVRAHRPSLLRLRPAYEAGLEDADATIDSASPAALAAESVHAPLLVLTGTDDEVWPSETMAATVLGRRRTADGGSAVADTHVSCPGAGHLIRIGVLPTDSPWTGGIAFGGSRAAQADADRRAADAVLAFLRSTVRVGLRPS